jgi:hypothetical protein
LSLLEDLLMRYPVMVLISLCVAGGGYLHAETTQEQKGKTTGPQASAAKPGLTDKKRDQRSQKSATTFKPTEKIRADSAVSFPVDI